MRYRFLQFSTAVASLALVSAATGAQLGTIDTFTNPKPANRVEYVYMNGVGLVVGGRIYHCNGQKTEWGSTGVFNDVYLTPCE